MRRIVFLLLLGAVLVCFGCAKQPSPTAIAPRVPTPDLVATEVAEPAQPPYVVDGKLVWGDLKGRFVFDGEIPALRNLVVSKDEAVCAPARQDESLLVDEKSRGIANVVVWLQREEGTPYRQHESLNKNRPDDVTLTIKGCRFEPHVQFITTRQRMTVMNEDSIGHNAFYNAFKNVATSRTVAATGREEWSFRFAESAPMSLACSIHPWMSGWILVLDHPYAAVTDFNGEFTLPKISVGKHRFRFWHERTGFVREVTIDGTAESLTKGAKYIEIAEEGVDLGEIHLDADQFNR